MSPDPYIANVTLFAGNFAPRSWMLCNGALISIAQYTALFALIGTYYGGDGETTFALPDLRGRVAIHPGQGGGLSPIGIGQVGGSETITATIQNLPLHTHALVSVTGSQGAYSGVGTSSDPTGNVPAQFPGGNIYNTSGTSNQGASPVSGNTTSAGNSQPISVVSPTLGLNYVIAVEGIFPSRN